MAEDIIMTLPRRYPNGWTHEHIWCYDNGSYSICDSDGNHEDLDEGDIPSINEHRERWRDYAFWVSENGIDPLKEFLIKSTVTREETWFFRLRPSILGVILTEAKHAGRRFRDPLALGQLPLHVIEYLDLSEFRQGWRVLGGFATWEEAQAALPTLKPDRWLKCKIDHTYPRAAYQRDLIRKAKRAAKEGY